MTAMMRGMEITPTGDIDHDFVDMMVLHHRGAIDMAVAVLRYRKNERLRRLAQEIIERSSGRSQRCGSPSTSPCLHPSPHRPSFCGCRPAAERCHAICGRSTPMTGMGAERTGAFWPRAAGPLWNEKTRIADIWLRNRLRGKKPSKSEEKVEPDRCF